MPQITRTRAIRAVRGLNRARPALDPSTLADVRWGQCMLTGILAFTLVVLVVAAL